MKAQLIWDLPTRLFHGLLIIGIAFQWASAEWFDNAIIWHVRIGYALLGLILFRLVWGVVGTRYAKFNQLRLSPTQGLTYSKTLLHRDSPTFPGHNPIGSWAVICMLLLIALQAISGLFVSDDIFTEGPYRSVASSEWLAVMEFIHFQLFDLLLIFIALHIIAALGYQFYKRQAIITAMVNGKKYLKEDVGIVSSKLLRAFLVAIVVAAIVYFVIEVLPPEPEFYY
ncbi:cytochrome b/b6 domain-containing protein [Alteromonas flava]|uniref:cytochrome b/b6 domain-containing protein n=1 Tax=Alteromonas flava TaxID=2048003 RepID=UPI000C2923E6|nr:cytochrome b/b6 domain-containing protein [Alteromonas flava]